MPKPPAFLFYVVSADLPPKNEVEAAFGVYLIKSPNSRGAHDMAKQHLRDHYKIPVQYHIRTRTLYSHPDEGMAREFMARLDEAMKHAES